MSVCMNRFGEKVILSALDRWMKLLVNIPINKDINRQAFSYFFTFARYERTNVYTCSVGFWQCLIRFAMDEYPPCLATRCMAVRPVESTKPMLAP